MEQTGSKLGKEYLKAVYDLQPPTRGTGGSTCPPLPGWAKPGYSPLAGLEIFEFENLLLKKQAKSPSWEEGPVTDKAPCSPHREFISGADLRPTSPSQVQGAWTSTTKVEEGVLPGAPEGPAGPAWGSKKTSSVCLPPPWWQSSRHLGQNWLSSVSSSVNRETVASLLD